MKWIFAFVLLVFSTGAHGLSCPKGSKLSQTTVGKGETENWCETSPNEKNGPFIKTSPEGKLLQEGHFLFSQKEGRWRTYYLDGILAEESHFRGGDLDGTYKSFFPNRKLESEGLYRKGWKSAIWKHYRESGELKNYIDYGGSRFQIYGHYYGVRTDTDISHFTALDMTYRWPALFLDRLLVESAAVIGWLEGEENDYVVTLAPEFRLMWCLGPWFRIGPLVGYEEWPRQTSMGSFGGRASFILRGTHGAELRNPPRSFTELTFTVKVLSKRYQIFMAGFDLIGFE
ncbi:MAG: hypothetical protein H6624_15855 [Bdellovibrionaceae bacterium]|nr:hypothetical protein [Bdellovibrionales bacterium]MCB9085822.1 hypothetical protein [Pseudobdellovibrionaceae bacterium]